MSDRYARRNDGGPTLAGHGGHMAFLDSEPVHFVAPDYTNWTVHEVHDPATEQGRSLIFVSHAGFRRVRQYPAEWRALPDAELWALSWSR